MREYDLTIPLKTGLRVYGDGPTNQGGLERCYNVKPYKGRLIAITPVVLPLVGSLPSVWPFPQLFCLTKNNYACSSSAIHTLDSNLNVVLNVSTSTATAMWTVADFHDYVIFCNGANIYTTDPTTGVITPQANLPFSPTTLYTGRSICAFKGQIIVAAPADYDSNVVMWSDIGRATMDPADSIVVGWMPMPWSGTTEMVLRLGDHVVAYGDGGVACLTPITEPAVGMSLRELSAMGVSGQAVGGDIRQHVYVREDGMLCKVTPNPEYPRILMAQEIGYQEFFAPMLGDDIRVSFDPGSEEYYISNGELGYVLAPDGLYKIYQSVISCQFYRGGLVGTAVSSVDLSLDVCTSKIDFNARGSKSIEYLECQTNIDLNTSAYWKTENSDSFIESPSVPLLKVGAARLKVSGMDLKVRLQADSFVGAELDYLTIHWKRQDKRFVRGLDVSKATS